MLLSPHLLAASGPALVQPTVARATLAPMNVCNHPVKVTGWPVREMAVEIATEVLGLASKVSYVELAALKGCIPRCNSR